MSESDLISPRFMARVERSLLKRISGDIRPHLIRCAAHAHSKHEFLASCARLLANPKEREQWLASWIARTQARAEARELARSQAATEGTGSAPPSLESIPAPFHYELDLDLDTTMPAELDLTPRSGFRMTLHQREELRAALAREVGLDTAAGLLEAEIRRADTAGELLARLQSYLASDSQRLRFVNSAIATLDPAG